MSKLRLLDMAAGWLRLADQAEMTACTSPSCALVRGRKARPVLPDPNNVMEEHIGGSHKQRFEFSSFYGFTNQDVVDCLAGVGGLEVRRETGKE